MAPHLNQSYHERRKLGLRVTSDGELEGRDPREMPISLMEEIGHSRSPLLTVIRSKCLDCAHKASEVAKCTAIDCNLWPYRMGTNPFRAERSEAQKAAAVINAERLRNSRKINAAPQAPEKSAS